MKDRGHSNVQFVNTVFREVHEELNTFQEVLEHIYICIDIRNLNIQIHVHIHTCICECICICICRLSMSMYISLNPLTSTLKYP